MEIDEMKTLWDEMSMEIRKQKIFTESIIIEITQSNYKNKLSRILIPEIIGAFACLAGILFILVSFQKLDRWYLLGCGIVSILILFLLPVLSIKAIHNIRSVHISENNYKQSLLEYAKGKLQFVLVQKRSLYLGSILMLVILPVMGKLIGGTDFFKSTSVWYWYAIGFPFFYYFARWVFKSYNRTASDAENILKELDN
jgi:hypothetical protein